MRARRGCWPLIAAGLLALAALGWFVGGWYSSGPLARDTAFTVPDGASLSAVARKLEAEGVIADAQAFRLRARVFGAGAPIKAGEFMFPKGGEPGQGADDHPG